MRGLKTAELKRCYNGGPASQLMGRHCNSAVPTLRGWVVIIRVMGGSQCEGVGGGGGKVVNHLDTSLKSVLISVLLKNS